MHSIDDPTPIKGLFADYSRGRGLLDAALQSGQGTIRCDDPAAPSLVHLQVGGFALFGGDPHHAAIPRLMASLPPTWIIPESTVWEKALLAPVAPRVKKRQRSHFSPSQLKIDALPPPPPDYRIVPVERIHVEQRRQPDGRLWAFPSVAAFAARGLGFCALAGNTVAAYAVSYAASASSIEIEVQTSAPHRRRGLGFCLCSRLIGQCLEQGKVPHWDAANAISCRLAEKLGYLKVEEYLSFRRLRADELDATGAQTA